MNLKTSYFFLLASAVSLTAQADEKLCDVSSMKASISLKVPGNDAVTYNLKFVESANPKYNYELVGDNQLPVLVYENVENTEDGTDLNLMIVALDDIYFNYGQRVSTGYSHGDCQFCMPGFWYRQNLRSQKNAPSFRTSDSWEVREDRLSSPVTAIYDTKKHSVMSVSRLLPENGTDALTAHTSGEVIVSGNTSIGYTGFVNDGGTSYLSFGFPYKETPRTYVRKLTLYPATVAFQYLPAGKSITLKWRLNCQANVEDFSECVSSLWERCYDLYKPQTVDTEYDDARMKEVLSNFFVESYMGDKPLKYYSGVWMQTSTCANTSVAEVGFTGRTLLNAFNALEYAEEKNLKDMAENARSVFDSYLACGFSDAGFIKELVDVNKNSDNDGVRSIRRQSEGVYAFLYYLDYEKRHGRKHPDLEMRLKTLLDSFLKLQNADGSFPRKFKDDFNIVDKSGGSTPSATLPLVMAYKYFGNKAYLNSAKRTAEYLENELISKSDYFSSTLDADCEDKEASLYASTATYYLALASKGKERKHYAELSRKAAYFALSWYYTWDVPFAKGQMLGDIGLKTRGWSNVSVENNHIDVFVFDFTDALRWLSNEFGEKRFSDFADVISSSVRQLLPLEGHLCGVAKKGFYPEVVQHTNWDYGKNGRGFYNDIFAPGWTVASLWEMLSPGRAERFIENN